MPLNTFPQPIATLAYAPPPRPRGSGAILTRVIAIPLTLCLVAYAGYAGWELRNWLWDNTKPVRFQWDIRNGYNWGQRTLFQSRELAGIEPRSTTPITWAQFFVGYHSMYDRVEENASRRNTDRYGLDYSPLRLLVMSAWVKHLSDIHPDVKEWRDEDTWPLLRFNLVMEALAAVLIFGVVYDSMRRFGRGFLISWTTATIGMLVSWFNASTLLDAQAWPQWDVWLVPFFVAAMWASMRNAFFIAGLSVALGSMLKGQILIVAPVLLLFAIFAGNISGALRMLIGFCFAFVTVTSVWLIPSWNALAWVMTVTGIAAIYSTVTPRFQLRTFAWIAFFVAPVLAIVWPMYSSGSTEYAAMSVTLVAAATLIPVRRGRAHFIAFIFVCAMLLASLHFNGSWAWAKIGYGFPTRNYQTLAMGPSSNIPAILQHVYGWQIFDTVWTAPKFADFFTEYRLTTMRTTLVAIYGALLVVCAIAAARHARKCDPKLLVALTAPWIAMFALMPQMHERYLTYAAAVCGVAIASSLGLAMLHIVIIAISSTMVFHCMLAANGSQLAAHSLIARTHPHLGWMVALLAAIFVYCACTPSRRFDNPAPARQNRLDASEAS